MTKRWRYRKVSPKIVEEMKELREEGWSFTKIGKKFNLNPRTVKYWLDEEYRNSCIERAKKLKKKTTLSAEQKERQREYIRNYIRNRYNSDPEFRERFLRHTKKWQDKQRKKLKEEKERM